MDKKTKIFILLLFLFFLVTVGAKYYKFSVIKDFYISAEITCEPETEACFVWDCDVTEEDCDQSPYKYIWKYAANVPNCDPRVEECEELVCEPEEEDCEIIYCSDETLGEEEFCYSEND